MGDLRLDELLTKGQLKDFRMTNGDKYYPPTGKNWMLLSGVIGHVTGTATNIWMSVHQPWAQHEIFFQSIPAATATGSYPLFRAKAEEQQALWSPVIITDEGRLFVEGDAGCKVNINLIEW